MRARKGLSVTQYCEVLHSINKPSQSVTLSQNLERASYTIRYNTETPKYRLLYVHACNELGELAPYLFQHGEPFLQTKSNNALLSVRGNFVTVEVNRNLLYSCFVRYLGYD